MSKLLVATSQVNCVCASSTAHKVIFAGTADGSILLYDINEKKQPNDGPFRKPTHFTSFLDGPFTANELRDDEDEIDT